MIRGLDLAEKLAFMDKDITLSTKTLEESQTSEGGFLGFCLKELSVVNNLCNLFNQCDFFGPLFRK